MYAPWRGRWHHDQHGLMLQCVKLFLHCRLEAAYGPAFRCSRKCWLLSLIAVSHCVGLCFGIVTEFSSTVEVTVGSQYKNTLILIGNPVCSIGLLSNTDDCSLQQQPKQSYSTSLANCGGRSCPPDQNLSPQSCECAYPYQGTMSVFLEQVLLCATLAYEMLLIPGCSKVCQLQVLGGVSLVRTVSDKVVLLELF
ncbi:hypothetical protein KIW84_034114 [Lathyrus oleraceus]|uniref:Uncharacterized protein n=1 Tax=Pisum sativum TaxID=3888 RepID=A0A9D5B3Z9_PEA|nr:hypothetical protein KIW84_034114 [Pisum sativum]